MKIDEHFGQPNGTFKNFIQEKKGIPSPFEPPINNAELAKKAEELILLDRIEQSEKMIQEAENFGQKFCRTILALSLIVIILMCLVFLLI